jgi:hypothetical protein
MPLQSSGQISLLNIADEFKRSRTVISLSDFYKVPVGSNVGNTGKVKAVGTNSNIPESGTIKVSNFYGASNFWMQVYFDPVSETYGEYGGNDNGYVSVWARGSSASYRITVNGVVANVLAGVGHQFTGLNGNTGGAGRVTGEPKDVGTTGIKAYTISVYDPTSDKNIDFTANIGYRDTSSYISNYAKHTWHDVG